MLCLAIYPPSKVLSKVLRDHPIFPILSPSFLPLSPQIAFGLISPKGDVVYEALKPCPPNTHNTTTTREAPNLHICNFEKRLELGFFSAETGRLSKPSTLYLHKQGTYFHRFSKNFGTSKTTSALPKTRYLFSSPFIGSEGVPPPPLKRRRLWMAPKANQIEFVDQIFAPSIALEKIPTLLEFSN